MRHLLDSVCRQCGTPFRYVPKGHEAKFCSRACMHLWMKTSGGLAQRGVRTPIGEFPSKSAAVKAFLASMEPI